MDELKPDFVHLCDGICAGNGSRPLGGANCTELREAEAALSTTLLNDATLPPSDLAFAVSMRGLTSMYLFCCAVVLASLGAEFLDDRRAPPPPPPPPPPTAPPRSASRRRCRAAISAAARGSSRRPPRLNLAARGAAPERRPRRRPPPAAPAAAAERGLWRRHERARTRLVLLQLTLTVAMCSLLFMRHVDGTLTAALKDRGFDFDGQVSMIQMGRCGRGGRLGLSDGDDLLVVCIVRPVVRPLSLLLLLHAPLGKWRRFTG